MRHWRMSASLITEKTIFGKTFRRSASSSANWWWRRASKHFAKYRIFCDQRNHRPVSHCVSMYTELPKQREEWQERTNEHWIVTTQITEWWYTSCWGKGWLRWRLFNWLKGMNLWEDSAREKYPILKRRRVKETEQANTEAVGLRNQTIST